MTCKTAYTGSPFYSLSVHYSVLDRRLERPRAVWFLWKAKVIRGPNCKEGFTLGNNSPRLQSQMTLSLKVLQVSDGEAREQLSLTIEHACGKH